MKNRSREQHHCRNQRHTGHGNRETHGTIDSLELGQFTALVIMAVGQLVNCLLPCQDIVLAMTGHGHWLQRLNLLQFATCLVLASVLIPAYGMLGAALVTAATIIQGAVGTTLVVRRVLPGAF